jgi:hypothetical protein
MGLLDIWREVIGDVGREVARVASTEIAERVSGALASRVHEALRTGHGASPTGPVRCGRECPRCRIFVDLSAPPANDNNGKQP